MKILFFGDIIGKIGRRAIQKALPGLRKKYQPDLIIANVENIAHGQGITSKTLGELEAAGINFFTSGNHTWEKEAIKEILIDQNRQIIRPANFKGKFPGSGYRIIKVGKENLLVINLLGQVFMDEEYDSPFKKLDEILLETRNKKLSGILVDFHAEVTSEKVAFKHYADGRVSAILGTHTHIPTADPEITDKGMAYITDIGMVGAKDSIIGVDKESVLRRFLTDQKGHHEIPKSGQVTINAVYLELEAGKAKKLKRVDGEVEV